MSLKIAAGQVYLCPRQHSIEMRAIIGGQREEQGVRLTFGCSVLISPVVEHPAL